MPNLPSSLEKIDSLRQQLEKLKPLKREDEERLWKKFRLEWNYNSNHIEGSTLTYKQTELLLIFEKTTGDHDMREYEEMKAHDVALRMVTEFAKDPSREITESDIREINKIILVRPFWSNAQTPDGQPTRKLITPGDYKKESNSVLLQNGEMFHYASPEDTPVLMKELLEWYADAVKQKKLHPVEIAALIHYKFVRIHPFDDSNGRTSRLLMNYVLLRYGYPPVIIKSADKKSYLNALNKADVGDVNAFVEYVSEQVVWSFEIGLKVGGGESIEELDDVDKEILIWKRGKTVNDSMSKSPKALMDVLSNGLTSLLQDHAQRIDVSFTSVFEESTVEILYSTAGSKLKRKEIISSDLRSFFRDTYLTYLKDCDEKYQAIDFVKFTNSGDLIAITNQLKSSNGNSFFWKIEIEFARLEYVIRGSSGFGIVKNYSQGITQNERQEIITRSLKDLFAHIKEQESKN